MSVDIKQRKIDHLDLCASDKVAFREKKTLFDGVRLVHQSLPDLGLEDIDLSVEFFGKKLKAPLFIAAMTGGNERAAKINQDLAIVAEEGSYGFGLGSQRAMHKDPSSDWTYKVRQYAPNVLLLANIGVVQARNMSSSQIVDLIGTVDADALCVHMNPAMELIQPEGDRDFSRCSDTFARLVQELSVPVVAKETGNGLSRTTLKKLKECGVATVDVSGAGGTSWVGVETLRAKGDAKELGELIWDWGVPTAASVAYAAEYGFRTIATGGVVNAFDVARALALGANAAGMARIVLKVHNDSSRDGVFGFLNKIEDQLRSIMLLCGAASVSELARAERVICGELKDWLGLE